MRKANSVKRMATSILLSLVMVMISLTPVWSSPDNATMYIQPDTQTVEVGDTFTVNIKQDVDIANILVQCTLSFDHDLLQVLSITAGPQWTGAAFVHGTGNPPLADFIAQSNLDGEMETMSCMWIGGGPTPAGDHVFLAIEFQAIAEGTSALEISDEAVGDTSGGSIPVTTVDGEVVVSGGEPMPDLVISEKAEEWVTEGETYTVSYTVENRGSGDAGEFVVALYLDASASAEASETITGGLAAGATYSGSFSDHELTLTGDSDIIEVCADSEEEVDESNENNNCKENIWTSAGAVADLVIAEKAETWVVEGETYTVSYTVENQGSVDAEQFEVGLYIDGSTDAEATETITGGLAAGATYSGTFDNYQVELTELSDTVKVCADSGGDIAEGEEDNNCSENTLSTSPPNEGEVLCTVKGAVEISITVTDGEVLYGAVGLGECVDTSSEGLDDSQTVRNTGELPVDLSIRSSHAIATQPGGSDWPLAAAVDQNSFTHQFKKSDQGTWTYLTTEYQALESDLEVNETVTFDLRFCMPQSPDDYEEHTITITIQAMASD